jgi:SNF2 family DNA or RNA helicase
MSAVALESPASESAPGPLYHSDWGLLPFQQKIVIECYSRPAALVVADTGLGKTHVDLATAALLFEDDEIDVHLLVCEQNKVDEWAEDFARYTRLNVVRYYGPATKRRKIIESLSSDKPVKIGKKKTDTVWRPQVLISTYETFRNDMAKTVLTKNAKGRDVEVLVPHMLTDALVGKRVVVGYDEMTKLGNRGSGTHKAHALFLDHTGAKPIGLTATPIDRSPENYYNLGRILCPEAVGTVASFAKDHVKAYDLFGNASAFKNLTPEDATEPWVTPLSVKMAPVLIRKRETDDDVRHQFPEKTEKFIHVALSDRHQEFYEVVRDTFADADEYTQRQVFTLMRQIAGHPLSLLKSEGKFAKIIVEKVGEEGLAALGSAKLDMLADRLKPLILGQGAQAVVFTFFGPSMIPLIKERLEDEGITVALNYPAIGDQIRREHKAEFKAGNRRVFLTSDAGARGINLPQASYVFEYESALTFSNRQQRINRIHRIDSKSEFGIERVYAQTLVAKDTVEEGIADGVLRRNAWSDSLLEDDDPGESFVTAADRKRLLAISRSRAV